jgi:hypothetical protein
MYVARHIAPLPGYSKQVWTDKPRPYNDDVRCWFIDFEQVMRDVFNTASPHTLRKWAICFLPRRYLRADELACYPTYDGLKQAVINDLATRSFADLVARLEKKLCEAPVSSNPLRYLSFFRRTCRLLTALGHTPSYSQVRALLEISDMFTGALFHYAAQDRKPQDPIPDLLAFLASDETTLILANRARTKAPSRNQSGKKRSSQKGSSQPKEPLTLELDRSSTHLLYSA